MPGIIDLAWRVSGGDVQFVTRAMAPGTPQAYQELGQYFRQRKEVGAAIAMYAAAGNAGEAGRKAHVGELISAEGFKDAANLLAVCRPPGAAPGVVIWS